MLEHLGWIGKAETAAADVSFDYFLIYMACFLATMVFACWCCIINLELYMLCPGWGPVRRFDSDGNEEMRINQLVLHEGYGGQGHLKTGVSKGVKGADGRLDFLAGALKNAGGEVLSKFGNGQQDDEKEDRRHWDDMPQAERSSWVKLGYTRELWDMHRPPATMEKVWSQLSVEEKGAARKLGFEARTWDEKAMGKSSLQKAHADSLMTGNQESYGTIGKCTWGYCESPYQWGEKRYDPRYGEVVVRHGFSDTQWMRQHSQSWAKDEPHFMMENGMSFPPLTLQDECTQAICHRMVIERGGY